jgi:putative ABC transport system permease protein
VRAAPVLTAAWAGTARRLVQPLVVVAVLAVSSAAAVTGLTLVAAPKQAYTATLKAQHGADLTVTIAASKVTAGQLAETRHLPGVTQDAGPYPQTTITVTTGTAAAGKQPGGQAPETLTVVGRASPSGPLDDIGASPSIMAVYGHQRWPDRLGEISLGVETGFGLPVGSKVAVISAPGRPVLTVTGYGDNRVNYQDDAWVVPGEIAKLRAAGAPAQEQMLYSFASADTAAQVRADLAELKAALPRGAVTGSQSLRTQEPPGGPTNVNTAFAVAFGVLSLVLAGLITANVISAAVIASYRRIGVLKSIGFTPGQVAATYLAQISIPAVAGAVAGTLLGNRWVLPVINPYPAGGVNVFIPLWISLTAALGTLALAGLAAAVPAVRAGRLHAVEALTAGQAPRAGRGALAYRLAELLGLPVPVTVGLASPFSRPARSAVMLAALMFGITGVVLGTSLNASIIKINNSALHGLGQLNVRLGGGRTNTFTPSQEAAVRSAIAAQPGTLHYAAEADLLYSGAPGPRSFFAAFVGMPPPEVNVSIAKLPDVAVMSHAYNGASSWLGWSLVTGRWYDGPGQIDVSTAFAAWAGVKAGDNVTLSVNGKPVTARVAGEVFIPVPLPTIWVSWQTLGMPPALTANQYDIGLTPGTSAIAYTDALQRALGPGVGVGPPAGFTTFAGLDLPLFEWLTILVAVLAALGVLNAALMATRERVHDLGVFKAVGMTPRQTITMVICWVIAPAIIAAAIALPAGLIIHDVLVRQLAPQGFALPRSFVHVLTGTDLLILVLAGLAIAILGALGPAGWAAKTRTSAALQAE